MPLYVIFILFFIFIKYDIVKQDHARRTNAVFPEYRNVCKCVTDFIQQFKLILSELDFRQK